MPDDAKLAELLEPLREALEGRIMAVHGVKKWVDVPPVEESGIANWHLITVGMGYQDARELLAAIEARIEPDTETQ